MYFYDYPITSFSYISYNSILLSFITNISLFWSYVTLKREKFPVSKSFTLSQSS